MFPSMDDQIESTEGGRPTAIERLIRFAGITVLSVVVFGGLYLVVVALE